MKIPAGAMQTVKTEMTSFEEIKPTRPIEKEEKKRKRRNSKISKRYRLYSIRVVKSNININSSSSKYNSYDNLDCKKTYEQNSGKLRNRFYNLFMYYGCNRCGILFFHYVKERQKDERT